MTSPDRIRAIAYYLPQFHPIPENDRWWGKGFTEWTNVTKARPLFRGHHQPDLPGELGFYDLRVPEVREVQADLARAHGIEGFCYWHYWLGGRRLLERPFDEVLASGRPDFPFCLGWANHDWTGEWSGNGNQLLIRQPYPGPDDERAHFAYLSRAFADPRYIRVDGKPLLVVYRPHGIPDSARALAHWRELARAAGLPGLHLVATLYHSERHTDVAALGYDAMTVWPIDRVVIAPPRLWRARLKRGLLNRWRRPWLERALERLWRGSCAVFDYEQVLPLLVETDEFKTPYHPMAIPNWDTTPRFHGGPKNIVFHDSTPELFRRHLRTVCTQAARNAPGARLVFLKSWNEWAEGNYLEPCARFGSAYLEVIRDELGAK